MKISKFILYYEIIELSYSFIFSKFDLNVIEME